MSELNCEHNHKPPPQEFEALPAPIKSASDKKEYKVIRLKNGLTACLAVGRAHDGGKTAGASLCLNVGSFSDPKNTPGVAHLLERLIADDKRFPKESLNSRLFSSRGSSSDCERTLFYFQFPEEDLYTELEKFAQIFISPSFERSSIDKQIEDIHSEFQRTRHRDICKKDQLLASIARAESPLNNFDRGNFNTLKNVTEENLKTFMKRHYSAHRMTLAIHAHLPLEALVSFVKNCFGPIPCNNLPPDDFTSFSDSYDTPEFNKIYHIPMPEQEKEVVLTWALPSSLYNYRSKPFEYISRLLSNPTEGSLARYLNKRGWARWIYAGNSEIGRALNTMYAMFAFSLELTDEGGSHVDDVIGVVFSYLKMLKEIGPQKRVFNERKIIAETYFRFDDLLNGVEELARNMQMYPPEDYLRGREIYFDFDPDIIKVVLESLTPDKMNVVIFDKCFPPGNDLHKTEKWFETEYVEREIPKDLIEKWNNVKPLPEFSLPSPNNFLAEYFTILPKDENHPDYPQKIFASEKIEVWFRKDQEFNLPLAYYTFYLINPHFCQSLAGIAMIDLFVDFMRTRLYEESYTAADANLFNWIGKDDKGIVMQIAGYNEKLPMLIETTALYLTNFNSYLTETLLNDSKKGLLEQYHNRVEDPETLARESRHKLLVENYQTDVDVYNEISSVTLEDMKKFVTEFFANLYIEALVQGNVSKETAITVVDGLVNILKYKPIPRNSYPKFKVAKLPEVKTFCKLKSFGDFPAFLVSKYYQLGFENMRDRVYMEILTSIFEPRLRDCLKADEVNCRILEIYGILGFTISAFTEDDRTLEIETKIEGFLSQIDEIFTSLSLESFEKLKVELIEGKQKPLTHLRYEVDKNWEEIANDKYYFNRTVDEVKKIEGVNLDDVRTWWNEHKFRTLSIHVSTEGKKVVKPEKLSVKFLETDDGLKNFSDFKQNLYYRLD